MQGVATGMPAFWSEQNLEFDVVQNCVSPIQILKIDFLSDT